MSELIGHPPTQTQHGFAAIFLKIVGAAPFGGGDMQGGAIRLLSGYSSAYLLPAGDNQFVLIDTGSDPKAEEILSVLKNKGVGPEAVKAVFITHGHPDHTAGVRHFTDADVYIGAEDRGFIEGTAAGDGFAVKLAGKKPGLAAANLEKIHTVKDGETVTVGNVSVRAFMVPGHTRGSMVYLVGDVLFIGDVMFFDRKGVAKKPPLPASYSLPLVLTSLAKLIEQFDREGIVVQTVVPGHSGVGTFDALRKLVA